MSLPLLRRLAAWAVLVWITVSMQLGGTGHYQLAAWWLIAGAAAMVIGGVLVDSRYPLDEPLVEPRMLTPLPEDHPEPVAVPDA